MDKTKTRVENCGKCGVLGTCVPALIESTAIPWWQCKNQVVCAKRTEDH